MAVRNFLVRVKIDGVSVDTAAPVRIQQQLEGAVTSVAEIALAGATPPLVTNTPVTVHHVNKGFQDYAGHYDMRPLFTGVINRVSGVGMPHGVTISCTGPLAKLRRTRQTDLALSGKTDIEIAKLIFDYCDIDYASANIHGWNYTFGTAPLHGAAAADVRPYWRAGQSGADILGEIDRVTSCATIELGDGTVRRFVYSRAPYLYGDPAYAMTFVRGQSGASFYGNERDRGDIDQIQNYWVIRGLSLTGGDGDPLEGCTITYGSTQNTDHAKLGPGVDVGPNEFASDLIDREELANAIAKRMMQWYNREPDNLRIQCGNSAQVWPGSLVLVKDTSYGIDLASDKRYLVTGISREGDTMSLDCVGGATGLTGAINAKIEVDCNTTTSDIGSNPNGTDPLPELPGLPDLGSGLDEGGGTETTEPENTDDPFLGCTPADDADAAGPSGGPTPPGIDYTYIYVEDMLQTNWRSDQPLSAAYRVKAATGDPEWIVLYLGSDLRYNPTMPVSAKTEANDVHYGTAPLVTISGEIYLKEAGWASINLFGFNADGTTRRRSTVQLLAPEGMGYVFTGRIGTEDDVVKHFGIQSFSENWIPYWSPYAPPNEICDELFHTCNNGGTDAEGGLPQDEWLKFSISFDLLDIEQKIYYTIGSYSGYMRDFLIYGEDFCFNPETHCEHDFNDLCDCAYHVLSIQNESLAVTSSPDDWNVRIRDVGIGYSTCERNPDFVPPGGEKERV